MKAQTISTCSPFFPWKKRGCGSGPDGRGSGMLIFCTSHAAVVDGSMVSAFVWVNFDEITQCHLRKLVFFFWGEIFREHLYRWKYDEIDPEFVQL